MISLSRAYAMEADAGKPLPGIWQQFVEHHVEFRQGQMSVVAAGPGGGKSVMALNMVVRMGEPALYLSADTDSHTTSFRVAALRSGHALSMVEAGIKGEKGPIYRKHIEGIDHVRWGFDSSPSIDDVTDEVEAFAHVYGEFPKIIVIDNLSNVYSDEEDNAALRHHMEAFNILARETNAHVLVLHHLTGEYESGDIPPPLRALIGKVGKMPALVLTMFRGQYGDIGVCIVKNRFGPADPRGNLRVYLPTDLERMKLG